MRLSGTVPQPDYRLYSAEELYTLRTLLTPCMKPLIFRYSKDHKARSTTPLPHCAHRRPLPSQNFIDPDKFRVLMHMLGIEHEVTPTFHIDSRHMSLRESNPCTQQQQPPHSLRTTAALTSEPPTTVCRRCAAASRIAHPRQARSNARDSRCPVVSPHHRMREFHW